MAHSETTYDGLLFFDKSEEEGSVAFTFTGDALHIGIQNVLGDDVEEVICENDARTLLAYLREKLGV